MTFIGYTQKQQNMESYYKDKQSGEIFTDVEMLELVDEDDNLDSFYYLGEFENKEAAKEFINQKQ